MIIMYQYLKSKISMKLFNLIPGIKALSLVLILFKHFLLLHKNLYLLEKLKSFI